MRVPQTYAEFLTVMAGDNELSKVMLYNLVMKAEKERVRCLIKERARRQARVTLLEVINTPIEINDFEPEEAALNHVLRYVQQINTDPATAGTTI